MTPRVFLWEIRKNVKRNAIIGVSVACVVMLILIAIVYNFAFDLLTGTWTYTDEEGNEQTSDLFKEMYYVTEDQVDMMIESAKEELAEAEKIYAEEKNSSTYSSLYSAKSALKTLEYVKENGLYNQEVRMLGINYYTSISLSAEGFVGTYKSIVRLIVIIYGVILAAGMFCTEYKSGTIKLLMTKPMAKNAMTLTKLIVTYVILSVAYLMPVLISYAYGAAAFGSAATKTAVYSFNAMGAAKTTVGAIAFGSVMQDLLQILVVATISFSLATITRNAAAGVVPSVVIMLGFGSLLSGIGVTAFLLSNAIDLSAYLGVPIAGMPLYGNFFLSLGILVFWLALAIAGVFVVNKKRDIY